MRVRPDPHHPRSDRYRRLLRSRPARRAMLRRSAAAAVCVVVGSSVAQRVQDAERTSARWGTTTELLVAVRDLPPGSAIEPGDVRRAEWPTALVPAGALDELPADARLRAPMAHGEALVAHRIDGSGGGEWAALLGPEQVAVQLPLSAPLPGAAPGDLVDVLAPDDATQSELTALAARRVATGARLLEVDEQHATVAVHRDEAVDTAGAALGGLVTVVVRR